MELKKCARRGYRTAWWLARGSGLFWANCLARYGATRTLRARFPSRGAIEILPAGIRLTRDLRLGPLLRSFDRLVDLASESVRITPGTPWDIIEIGPIKFQVFTPDAIFILSEIFQQGIYDLRLPSKAVVIDIGMNVGTAALFFAATLECPVYCFEPFRETYERALSNIALNPQLAAFIHPQNIGVAGIDKTVIAEFMPDTPGSCGLFPNPVSLSTAASCKRSERITLQSVSAIVDVVCAAHPDRHLVVKIDCEGAEYEIVDSLIASERMKRVSAMIVEWHNYTGRDAPSRLRDQLVEAGFVTFGQISKGTELGVLKACRVPQTPNGHRAAPELPARP